MDGKVTPATEDVFRLGAASIARRGERPAGTRTDTLHDSISEFFLHLSLKEGNDRELVYNYLGTVSVGDALKQNLAVTGAYPYLLLQRTILIPVTIDKIFSIDKIGDVRYRTLAYGDFRSYTGDTFCNVNGGATIVQYFSN